MTDFSYQLYCSRNFPPLSDTLQMLAAARLQRRRRLRRALRRRRQGRRTQRQPRRQRPHDADRPLRPRPAGERARQGAGDRQGRSASRRIYCPYLLPDQRPDTTARAGTPSASACRRPASPYRDAGLGFGWHNHDFEFKTPCRRRHPAGRDLRGRPRPRMGSRHRLGHPRRRRPARLDRDHRRPHHRRPCQGHRPRRRERRRGRLGRRRPRHRRLEGADGRAARRDARASTSSWSTTTPTTTSASPSARSPPRRSSEETDMTDTLGIGIIGCGNISDRLFPPRAALQGARGARLRRHQHGRRRGARQGVRRQGRRSSTTCSPTPTSTSSST